MKHRLLEIARAPVVARVESRGFASTNSFLFFFGKSIATDVRMYNIQYTIVLVYMVLTLLWHIIFILFRFVLFCFMLFLAFLTPKRPKPTAGQAKETYIRQMHLGNRD